MAKLRLLHTRVHTYISNSSLSITLKNKVIEENVGLGKDFHGSFGSLGEKRKTPQFCARNLIHSDSTKEDSEYLIQTELDGPMSTKAMIYSNRTFIFPKAKQL